MTDYAAVLVELQNVRTRFAEVHRRGMDSLTRRDLSEFDALLQIERELIEEQARLIKKLKTLGNL